MIGFFAAKGSLDNKPPHGAPCNRCGLCCMATLCPLAAHVFGDDRPGPCPALVKADDGFACGLTKHGTAKGREAATVLIGAGIGCDARFNDEPPDAEFYIRLQEWDRENEARVRSAKATWGMR